MKDNNSFFNDMHNFNTFLWSTLLFPLFMQRCYSAVSGVSPIIFLFKVFLLAKQKVMKPSWVWVPNWEPWLLRNIPKLREGDPKMTSKRRGPQNDQLEKGTPKWPVGKGPLRLGCVWQDRPNFTSISNFSLPKNGLLGALKFGARTPTLESIGKTLKNNINLTFFSNFFKSSKKRNVWHNYYVIFLTMQAA